ncbi:MAG: hypothetical protein AB7G25_09715 [Sphingomonadaceae bacterium]
MRRCARLLSSSYVLAIALLVFALGLRLFGIADAPARTDDLYNFIAAQSWAENGTLAMADGYYTRTRYFSIATAWFLEIFGENLGAARAFAALGGALLAPLTALWLRRTGNVTAAWVAGLLLCISYTCITWSQVVRFYSWHALAMLVLAITVFTMVTRMATLRPHQWALLMVCTLLALLVGMHLQAITVLMIVALAVWAGLFLLLTGRLNFIFSSPKLLLLSLVVVVVGVAAVLTVGRPILLEKWAELREASAWSQENQDNWVFYLDHLTHQLNWLFVLLPVAAIIAWRRYPTVTLFCVTISLVCLGLHTLAGMKALRYVIYLFPFMFAIWGLAFSIIVPALARNIPASPALFRPVVLGGGMLAVAAVSAVVVTDFRMTGAAIARAVRTGSTFQPSNYGFGRDQVFWEPYLPQLRALQKSGIFVVSDSNRAIYYLDDYDVLLSKTELSDIGTSEFLLDPRTGKRNISTGSSIRKVIDCYPKGTVLATEAQWRSAYVLPEAASVIEKETSRVPLPNQLNMRAYRWDHALPANPTACKPIYDLIGKAPERATR